MKIGQREIQNKWLAIAGVVMIVIVAFIFFSIPSCHKDFITPQATLNEALATAQAPLLKTIEDQKTQIANNQTLIKVSANKYSDLVQKYVDLEKRKNDVKPPTTNAELRDRFIALGYAPLPVK